MLNYIQKEIKLSVTSVTYCARSYPHVIFSPYKFDENAKTHSLYATDEVADQPMAKNLLLEVTLENKLFSQSFEIATWTLECINQ